MQIVLQDKRFHLLYFALYNKQLIFNVMNKNILLFIEFRYWRNFHLRTLTLLPLKQALKNGKGFKNSFIKQWTKYKKRKTI